MSIYLQVGTALFVLAGAGSSFLVGLGVVLGRLLMRRRDDVSTWSARRLEIYVGGNPALSLRQGSPTRRRCLAIHTGYRQPTASPGSRLRPVSRLYLPGCYAFERGAYAWPVVKAAYRRRLAGHRPAPIGFRRWPSLSGASRPRFPISGGTIPAISSLSSHLADICEIARRTPDSSHWIPTREYRIVSDYVGARWRDP